MYHVKNCPNLGTFLLNPFSSYALMTFLFLFFGPLPSILAFFQIGLKWHRDAPAQPLSTLLPGLICTLQFLHNSGVLETSKRLILICNHAE